MKNAYCVLLTAYCLLSPAFAESIPPHRALDLVGLHSYAEKSIEAGETIHFRTSSTVPYELSVCRLGPEVDDPAGDEVLFTFPELQPSSQPIHPGSYVHIPKGLPADEPLEALSMECWVRPFRLSGWQTMISQYDFPTACGIGLSLGPEGEVIFYLGDGKDYRAEWGHTGPKLTHLRWHHIVATWDGQTKSLWVDGRRVGQWAFAGPVRPTKAPLRLGACGYDGPAVNFLDGDLAMPVVYNRALSEQEILDRFAQQGLQPADGPHVLACWTLEEERSDRVADVSGHRRDGRIINCGTWMIGGPSFVGNKVPRYGDYDPAKDPRRGHGQRFASDDLYDCRWQVTQEYRLPKTARPGLYVGRYRFEIDGFKRMYHVTFIVKRPKDRPKAPILVLASSSSWLAYSATSFAVTPPGTHYHWGTVGITNSPGNPPAYCMYRNHHAGQPAYKVGVNLPWPSAGPYVLYAQGSSGYSHLTRAERFALVWLEESGYQYDMIGDVDLHRDPDQLDGYKTVIINGHGEYWSAEAQDALDRYLCAGGTATVLSGNVMVWRVSFNEDCTVMECRKFGPGLGGRENATIGELYHSHDGHRGSLSRECGMPAWKVIGLSMLGFWGIGPSDFGLYRVKQPDHFLLNHPEPVGLKEGEDFGGAQGALVPRPVGHECDVRLSLLRKLTKNVPPGATLPEEPSGITTLADGILVTSAGLELDYFTRPIRVADRVVAQMIYWQRPQGGRVFHAGSLGSGWGLSVDPKFQTLLRNVLHHFGVPRPDK